MLENSVSIPISSLNLPYIALCKSQDQNTAIEGTIDLFFTNVLNNYYQYEIVKNDDLIGEEESQTRTVSISKDGIGVIGAVTFQFSKDSVKADHLSNFVVVNLISKSVSPQASQQLAENEAFLKFGCSLERFNQAWKVLNKKERPEKAPSLLEMSFFGTVTETTEEHDIRDLAYEIALELSIQMYRMTDPREFENRCCILEALTQCIETGKIEDIQGMRTAASALRGANITRKLSAAGMAISVPVFIGGVILAVFAVTALGPAAAIIASVIVAVSMVVFIAGSLGLMEKPDFPSRAVLYLADKIENSLPHENASVVTQKQQPPEEFLPRDNNIPVITLENPSPPMTSKSLVKDTPIMPLLPVFQPIPTQDAAELLKQSFDQLCETSLKPALAKACGKENIDDNDKVFKSLKDGLATQLNEDRSMTIEQLKTKIGKAVSYNDQQERLSALYEACGVEKPKDFTLINTL